MYNMLYVPLCIDNSNGSIVLLSASWSDKIIKEQRFFVPTNDDSIVTWIYKILESNTYDIICSDSLHEMHDLLHRDKPIATIIRYKNNFFECQHIDFSEYRLYKFESNLKLNEVF